jgi:vacuolar-type H+-ATPase subunit I/STV1
MKSNTVFLARYIGAFTIIETILMFLYRTSAQQRIYDVLYDRALAFTYGLITLAIGLAIVTTHNVWRGGLLPAVVTIVGWLLLVRGVALQAIPPEWAQAVLQALHFEPLYYVYLAVPLALGAYLTIAGWMAGRNPEH